MVDTSSLVNRSKSWRIDEGLAVCDGTKVKPFDSNRCSSIEREMVGLNTTTLLVILLILRSGTLEWFIVLAHGWLGFDVVRVVIVPTVDCLELLSWFREFWTDSIWDPTKLSEKVGGTELWYHLCMIFPMCTFRSSNVGYCTIVMCGCGFMA